MSELMMYRGPIEDLMGRSCPNIPSDERILAADKRMKYRKKKGAYRAQADLRNTNEQEKMDAVTLARWYNAQDHRGNAMLELHRRQPANSDDMFNLLCDMAEDGHTKQMIGISSDRPNNLIDPTLRPDDSEDTVEINFDSVPRHPDWIGLSPIWSNFKDTDVVVIESNILPGQPGMVVGMPPLNIRDAFENLSAGTAFPEGAPQTVRDILRWHGAQQIHWWPTTTASSHPNVARKPGEPIPTWTLSQGKYHDPAIIARPSGWLMPHLHHFWQIQSLNQATYIAEYALSIADLALTMEQEALEETNKQAADGAVIAAHTMADRGARTASLAAEIARVHRSQTTPAVLKQVADLNTKAERIQSKLRRRPQNKSEGNHRWYADMCHRFLRYEIFVPIADQFLNHDIPSGIIREDQIFDRAQTLHQLSTWPTADIYETGEHPEGSEPDPGMAANVREKDQQVKETAAAVLAVCNERLTTQTTPFISMFPELDTRLRNTLFPLAGCIAGFEYATVSLDGDLAKSFAADSLYDEDLNPVATPFGKTIGSVGWTCFILNGVRIAKAVPEAYPKGFPAQAAEAHLFHIRATFADLIPDDETGDADPKKQPFANMCFALEKAINHNIHTLNETEIANLDDAAREAGLDTQTRNAVFREITLQDSLLFLYLTYNSPRESIALQHMPTAKPTRRLSHETATKLAATARTLGIPADMASRIMRLA